jgi:glycine betaine/proline transport system substrate-binding protein
MRFVSVSRKIVALLLLAGALAAGCGGSASGAGGTLTIGNIGWDENIAVSNLTKVLLEDELGYDNVELQLVENHPERLFAGVKDGELDAFQDVWLPNHTEFLARVEGDTELLEPWFRDTTRFSLAAPDYMGIDSIEEIPSTEAARIYGIEPGAVIMERIPNRVIPDYGLEQQLVASSTPAMLSEVDRMYRNEEPFIFVAWSPHWMNQEYDFTYLEDPKRSLGNLTELAEISTIVRQDLREDDPVAYAFMDALTLTEDQVNQLELEIRDAEDPAAGARRWIKDNRATAQPWISAAKRAQEG